MNDSKLSPPWAEVDGTAQARKRKQTKRQKLNALLKEFLMVLDLPEHHSVQINIGANGKTEVRFCVEM